MKNKITATIAVMALVGATYGELVSGFKWTANKTNSFNVATWNPTIGDGTGTTGAGSLFGSFDSVTLSNTWSSITFTGTVSILDGEAASATPKFGLYYTASPVPANILTDNSGWVGYYGVCNNGTGPTIRRRGANTLTVGLDSGTCLTGTTNYEAAGSITFAGTRDYNFQLTIQKTDTGVTISTAFSAATNSALNWMDAVDVIDNTPTTYTFNRVYLSIGMTQAKTTLSNVGIEIIPEPASVGLVLLGGKL